jgi:hypothetical protein
MTHTLWKMRDTPLTTRARRVRKRDGWEAAWYFIEANIYQRQVVVSTRKYRARKKRK